jgi:hypothetical protein
VECAISINVSTACVRAREHQSSLQQAGMVATSMIPVHEVFDLPHEVFYRSRARPTQPAVATASAACGPPANLPNLVLPRPSIRASIIPQARLFARGTARPCSAPFGTGHRSAPWQSDGRSCPWTTISRAEGDDAGDRGRASIQEDAAPTSMTSHGPRLATDGVALPWGTGTTIVRSTGAGGATRWGRHISLDDGLHIPVENG